MGKRTYFQRYFSQRNNAPRRPVDQPEQPMTVSQSDELTEEKQQQKNGHAPVPIIAPAESEGWSRVSRYFVGGIVLLIIIWFFYVARGLVAPLVIAGLISWLLYPIISFLDNRTKLPRTLIVSVVFIGAIGGIIFAISNFLPPLIEETATLTSEIIFVSEEVRMVVNEQLAGFNIDYEVPELDAELLNGLNVNIGSVFNIFQSASANFAWLLVILVTSFYLLKDWNKLSEWAFNYVPRKHQSDMSKLYSQVSSVWQGYLRGQFRLMVIVGFFSGLGAALVGLPGAVGIGFMAGIFDAVPTIGPFIAAVFATLVAFFQGSTVLDLPPAWFALLIFSIFAVVQMVENVWLRPRIMGQSTRLHPAIVFVGFMASLTLASILVTLVIIPLIATVGVIGRYLYCRIAGIDPWNEQPSYLREA